MNLIECTVPYSTGKGGIMLHILSFNVIVENQFIEIIKQNNTNLTKDCYINKKKYKEHISKAICLIAC